MAFHLYVIEDVISVDVFAKNASNMMANYKRMVSLRYVFFYDPKDLNDYCR